MSKPFISIRNLYKIFGTHPDTMMQYLKQGETKQTLLEKHKHTLALNNINLDIKKGETFVIMGLSGSGKSTLIRHFNRLIEPTSGSISIAGDNILKMNEKQLGMLRRFKISMVFQHFGLMPHKTVLENVAYGLKTQNKNKLEAQKIAQKWMSAVDLEGYENAYPDQLSGGQQQRVGLARALSTDADILLMDEAFSALDPLIRGQMQDQLIRLQNELKKTIVFITHDLDEALRLGDRIAILKEGELVQTGEPHEILLHPTNEYVASFVRDVNRARALTVKNVMQPPLMRIQDLYIDEALEQMKDQSLNYAHHVSEKGYEGLISKRSLQKILNNEGNQKLSSQMHEDIAPIKPDEILESVIGDTFESEYAIPVVDELGVLQGELSKKKLASVLTQK